MSLLYEELDFTPTEIGDLMLRRRRMPQFGDFDIYEVKLGEDFLMTNLFHESESQLAYKAFAAIPGDGPLSVIVGGLGLGYTAVAALEDQRVNDLDVIEFLQPVIDWHNQCIVPEGKKLTSDDRCRLINANFFTRASDTENGFDPSQPGKKYDAILLDIDHTPTNVLHQTNTRFYTQEGLLELKSHLAPGGVFALWADGEPEASFTDKLDALFTNATSHRIEFENPITGGSSVGAVYVATTQTSCGEQNAP